MWARPYTVGPHTYMVMRCGLSGTKSRFSRVIVSWSRIISRIHPPHDFVGRGTSAAGGGVFAGSFLADLVDVQPPRLDPVDDRPAAGVEQRIGARAGHPFGPVGLRAVNHVCRKVG